MWILDLKRTGLDTGKPGKSITAVQDLMDKGLNQGSGSRNREGLWIQEMFTQICKCLTLLKCEGPSEAEESRITLGFYLG